MKNNGTQKNERDGQLFVERVRLLVAQLVPATSASLINSLILSVVLWKTIDNHKILIWFFCVLTIFLIHLYLYHRYKRLTPSLDETAVQKNAVIVSLAVTGLIWGAAGVFLFPVTSIGHQSFIAFVLGGMVAGSVGSFSIFRSAFLAFSVPALLPIIIMFFRTNDEMHYAMGSMISLFWFIMFITAGRLNKDVTISLNLKHENLELISELENEISKREKDQELLRHAIVEAKDASRTKSEFLANMSHEIRTPMNGIIGMVELAMDTGLDKNQENLVATISAEAESLLSIINSILDFSKIEAGKFVLDMTPFNLRDLFEDISTTFAISAQKKGLEFISFMPPDLHEHLIGDPGRLRQILVNIAGNALKFTHRGEVYIKIESVEDLGDDIQLRFSVKDTGIGIPEDQQKIIFDSFSQADGSTTRKYGGTGLGTTISKQLVEMMGGTIGFDSKPFSGSTFWFILNFKKDISPSEPKTFFGLTKGLQVLVVDDNQNNRYIFSQYLKAFGCIPIEAHDGPSALGILSERARSNTPIQLMLSDFQMPGMSGLELAKQVKSLPAECHAPVIILTSIGMTDTQDTYKKAGILGCLSKPVRKDELKTAILSILNHGEKDKTENVPSPVVRPGFLVQSRKLKILLAEDYPTNQQVAIKHLTSKGFQVKLAENGQQALDLFKQDTFDLVLMDIQMPILDGYEATRMIRELEKASPLKRTPIIAMTAHATKGYREKCLDADMDDYITKPLKRVDLIALAEKWTHGRMLSKGSNHARSLQMDLFNRELLPSIPLDMEKALNEFENDQDFFEEVLGGFLENLEQQVTAMETAIRTSDPETIKVQAHAIKGGAANLAAMPLSSAAAALEESGKSKDFGAAQVQLALLKKEFGRLKTIFQTLQ